jgi:hypothetical protein
MRPLSPIPQNPVSNTYEWREWFTNVYNHLKEIEVQESLKVSGTFTSADGKTITVVDGDITSIV